MSKKPIEPTTRRVTVQFIVFAFYMIFAIMCIATGDRYDWLNVVVAVLLVMAAYKQLIMSHDEKQAWSDYQAENYRYTQKNQDYARRH